MCGSRILTMDAVCICSTCRAVYDHINGRYNDRARFEVEELCPNCGDWAIEPAVECAECGEVVPVSEATSGEDGYLCDLCALSA